MLYHPWRSIRMLPSWRVIHRRLDDDTMGYTHRPSHTIVLDDRLDQAERRSTLAHELEHVAAGHHGCQPSGVEREVMARCARRLLPVEYVIYGLRWTRRLAEFAEYVWVDIDTAQRRLVGLTDEEVDAVSAALETMEMTA